MVRKTTTMQKYKKQYRRNNTANIPMYDTPYQNGTIKYYFREFVDITITSGVDFDNYMLATNVNGLAGFNEVGGVFLEYRLISIRAKWIPYPPALIPFGILTGTLDFAVMQNPSMCFSVLHGVPTTSPLLKSVLTNPSCKALSLTKSGVLKWHFNQRDGVEAQFTQVNNSPSAALGGFQVHMDAPQFVDMVSGTTSAAATFSPGQFYLTYKVEFKNKICQ